MVLYGQASGAPDPLDVRRLGNGSLYLTRPGLGDYTVTRDELEERAGDVLGWVQSGELKLRVEHVFPVVRGGGGPPPARVPGDHRKTDPDSLDRKRRALPGPGAYC